MGKKSKTSQHKPSAKYKKDDRHDKRPDSVTNDAASEPAIPERGWRWDVATATATGLLLLALYGCTLYPSIPGGDSGELIVSAHEMGILCKCYKLLNRKQEDHVPLDHVFLAANAGTTIQVAHPPGYPVFTLAAKLAMMLIPWGSPAWRVNLLNAAFSAGAGAMLLLTLLRVTGCLASSLVAVTVFCLSPLTWEWSVTAEVFGLNNLLIAVLIFVAVVFSQAKTSQDKLSLSYLGAFVSAVCLCNQHTTILYIVCIVPWVLRELSKAQVLTVAVFLKLSICFVIGLVPYLYLPIASSMGVARWTWGDQTTLSGFMKHLLRSEYGTFDLGKNQEGVGFIQGIRDYLLHAFVNSAYMGVCLACLGAAVSIKQYSSPRGLPVVFPVMLVVYMCFFAWRSNLDTQNELMYGVVSRFWMQSDLMISLLAGYGLYVISRWQFFKESISLLITYSVLIGVAAVQLRHYPAQDQSGNVLVYDFAKAVLKAFPEKALVLTKGDLPTNSMRYLHYCEGERPDLVLIDQEIMSYEWSLPLLKRAHKSVMFPGDLWHLQDAKYADGRRSFTFKTFLDANYKRFSGIFVCIGMHDRDPSWQKGYVMWPFGVCHQLKRQGEPMDPYAYSQLTGQLAYHWDYPHGHYSNRSWEKVANDEMWHAKISTAFFMYQQAMATADETSRLHLFLNAYQLYGKAIQKHSKFPAYWHKNHALVCEKLLHMEHDMNKTLMVEESRRHFEEYLRLEPWDPEAAQIQDAINILVQRKKMYAGMDMVEKTTDDVMKRMEKLKH